MKFRSLVEKWADVWVFNEVADAFRRSEVFSRAPWGSRRRERKNSKRKGEEKYILRMISNILLVKLKKQPKIEFFLFGSSEFSFNSSKSVNA